jgi:hypothetical protein
MDRTTEDSGFQENSHENIMFSESQHTDEASA